MGRALEIGSDLSVVSTPQSEGNWKIEPEALERNVPVSVTHFRCEVPSADRMYTGSNCLAVRPCRTAARTGHLERGQLEERGGPPGGRQGFQVRGGEAAGSCAVLRLHCLKGVYQAAAAAQCRRHSRQLFADGCVEWLAGRRGHGVDDQSPDVQCALGVGPRGGTE